MMLQQHQYALPSPHAVSTEGAQRGLLGFGMVGTCEEFLNQPAANQLTGPWLTVDAGRAKESPRGGQVTW